MIHLFLYYQLKTSLAPSQESVLILGVGIQDTIFEL